MTNGGEIGPEDVIAFWRKAGPEKWFAKDASFDHEIGERFQALHGAAAAGLHEDWCSRPDGALALILLLDQFSRNMYRGTLQAFQQDALARDVARKALAAGFDRQVEPQLRPFFYMPLMHSESIADQERCVALCHSLEARGTLPFARDHERIIRRFGRFPHRNDIVGRHMSPTEQAFLDGGGFGG